MRTTPYKSRLALKQKEDRQGFVIMGACAAVIATGVVAFMVTRAPDRDAASGCLTSGPAPGHRVAVVDRTEKLDPLATNLLVTALKAWHSQAKPDERLTLYAFDGKASEPFQILYDQCRVPKGTELNALWTNTAKADARYADGFVAPFETAVTTATHMKSASETALAAYLGRLGAQLGYEAKGLTTHVTLFSDMGENGAAGSLIAKKPVEAQVFREHVAKSLGKRFEKIPVHIAAIPTPSTNGTTAKRIKEVWSKAFEAAGVTVTWEAL